MSRDLCLREDVERELGWEPIVPAPEIGVGVKNGVVTLMGVVDNYEAKHAAERAALRVPGVKALSSQLDVKPATPARRTDAEIAWAAANALAWNMPGDRIRPMVENGWVTLEGSVDHAFQRKAAEETVKKLNGVTGLTNLIVLRPGIAAGELKARVDQALRNTADLDARRIVVETDGDRITLWGCIASVSLRDAAEQAAWSVAGVSEVSNHLTVAFASMRCAAANVL